MTKNEGYKILKNSISNAVKMKKVQYESNRQGIFEAHKNGLEMFWLEGFNMNLGEEIRYLESVIERLSEIEEMED